MSKWQFSAEGDISKGDVPLEMSKLDLWYATCLGNGQSSASPL